MPDINPEMLKQLLAEFEEKQAVTTEEIYEIEKQIEELQARILLSRDRLQGVEADRDKIGAMKARYAGGDWSSVLSELAAQKSAAPEPAAKVSLPEKIKKGKSSNAEASDNGSGKKSAPEPAPAPAPEPTPEPTPQETPAAPPPLAPTMEMDMPQTLPTPPAPPTPPSPTGESLFPFSQVQESTGDLPWAPTPAMSWDSVAAQSFPPPDISEPQPTGFPLTPDGTNPFLDAGQKLGIPNPQPFGQPPAMPGQPAPAAPAGFEPPAPFPSPAHPQPPVPPPLGSPGAPQPPQPPQQAMSSPGPGNPEFLSTAFDDEFDIADALRSDNDQPAGEKEEGDVKKINDALRGLFS